MFGIAQKFLRPYSTKCTKEITNEIMVRISYKSCGTPNLIFNVKSESSKVVADIVNTIENNNYVIITPNGLGTSSGFNLTNTAKLAPRVKKF
jgi:hypothetical protein